MRKYKRLTETLNYYTNGTPCKPYGHCLANCMEQKSIANPERLANDCGECEHFAKVLTRLAKLYDTKEQAIENWNRRVNNG